MNTFTNRIVNILLVIAITYLSGSETKQVNAYQSIPGQQQISSISTEPSSNNRIQSDPRSVSTGVYHACAINAAGGVECWGYNEYGQLGDGSIENRPTPVGVVGLASGVVSVSSSEYFTCALTSAGGVKCWGDDPYRDGTNHDPSIPRDIPGMTENVAAISSGSYHICALMNTGTVQCWGSNFNGQLGDGTKTTRYIPAEVQGLDIEIAAISAGGSSTCAITVNGGVKCWGKNDAGQLGDNTITEQVQPVDVVGLTSGVIAIDVGKRHACAVTVEGTVKCWGSNEYGQLGDSTTTNSSIPVDVVELPDEVVSVSAGQTHTCALSASGGVKCWGSNRFGQLGDGSLVNSSTPVEVVGLQSGVKSISAGDRFTCGVTPYSIKCWGWGDFGQLGFGTAPMFSPVRDGYGLTVEIQAVSTGYYHSCALSTASGGVSCWGKNNYGQLGNGSTEDSPIPIDVSGLTSSGISISANGFHTCAATILGGVKCWGSNWSGQLGDGTTINRDHPVDVKELNDRIVSVTAGESFTCALTDKGEVKCWGYNGFGQLGNGTYIDSLKPVDVEGIPVPVKDISAGAVHICAITITNQLFCWGSNELGELGNGTYEKSAIPLPVNDLTNQVKSVRGGWYHTCALTINGDVKCWGNNSRGQLGDGTLTNAPKPIDVVGIDEEVIAIGSGWFYSCAAMKSGGAKCWGANDYWNLGDGTIENGFTPVTVVGLNDPLQSMGANLTHVCAVTINGGVKCWGSNDHGELTMKIVTIPTDVTGLSTYPFVYYYPVIMR